MEMLYGMLGFAGSIGVGLFAMYNQMVTYRRKAEQATLDLSTQFNQRAETVQALIGLAKKYLTIDPTILQKVEEAQAKAAPGTAFGERIVAENQLSSLLKAILAILEPNGEVQKDQQFLFARQALGDVEGLIQRARSQYSTDVGGYNTLITSFPGSLFARILGYKPYQLFEYSPSVFPNPSMTASMQAMMVQPMMSTQQPTSQSGMSFPQFPNTSI